MTPTRARTAPRSPRQPRRTSDIEEAFATLLRLYLPDAPTPEREYVFAPPRKFRADFAFLDARVLVECEGGIFIAGKHGRGSGIYGDCEKARFACVAGWRVFRVTSKDLDERPSEIFEQLDNALKGQTL